MNKIHKNTFRGCTSLTSVVLPTSISAIDDGAFVGCTSLKDVTLGENVKFVGTSAFCGDIQLSSVDRFNDEDPNHTFDMVGNYAFSGTAIKKANLALRSSSIYTFWGDSCFQDCKNLEDVHILSANYLSKHMFKGCTKLSNITFDVELMAYTYPGVFDGCSSLVSIILPSKLLFVPEDMFKDCLSLTSLNFTDNSLSGSSIQRFWKNAFYNSKKCSEIHFPASINNLEQIDDATLSNTNVTDLYLHGIPGSICGIDSGVQDPIYYGTVYDISTIDEFEAILRLWTMQNIPLMVITEFMFSYYPPNEYNNPKTVYFSTMNKDLRALDVSDSRFVQQLETFGPSFRLNLNTISYDGTTYDITKRKGIVVRANVDISESITGDAFDSHFTPQDLLKKYLKENKKDYNLLTYLWSKDFMRKITDSTVQIAFGSCYSRTQTSHALHNQNIGFNDSLLQKILWKSCHFDDFYDISKKLEETTAIPTVDLNPILKQTGIFRAMHDYDHTINLHCYDLNGEEEIIAIPHNSVQPIPYVKPIEYMSDNTTTINFKFGKWYYNAKELYEQAKRQHKPCLFIYSLLGCGPCAIYQKTVWNNKAFQDWSKQYSLDNDVYLCGMEVTTQPYYDKELSFCVDELSLMAVNFKTPSKSESSIVPNLMGQTFFQRISETGELASNLMTPVLVFMKSDGTCYDYTFHNIDDQIAWNGEENPINFIKALCDSHFKNMPFEKEKYEYPENQYPENPWKVNENSIDLGKVGITTVQQAENYMLTQLYKQGIDNGGLYLGGCLFADIDFIKATFNTKYLENHTTIDEIESELSKWYIHIGDLYYQLYANANDFKMINNPCGAGGIIPIFKITFVQK